MTTQRKRIVKILITAGSTITPIDRVRELIEWSDAHLPEGISNIFKGKTGTEIACAFGYERPHEVTLITSNEFPAPFQVRAFRTFDDLAALMEREITTGAYDVVIHSAAVSDYRVAGIEVQHPDGSWVPAAASGKLSSLAPGMRLTLAPTPKLLDHIRNPWGFTGKLVQFKLEVGITDEELVARAKRSLARSQGDLVVANCLEWMRERALLVGADDNVEEVKRSDLPRALVEQFSAR